MLEIRHANVDVEFIRFRFVCRSSICTFEQYRCPDRVLEVQRLLP